MGFLELWLSLSIVLFENFPLYLYFFLTKGSNSIRVLWNCDVNAEWSCAAGLWQSQGVRVSAVGCLSLFTIVSSEERTSMFS